LKSRRVGKSPGVESKVEEYLRPVPLWISKIQKTAPPKASKEKVARNPNNANILKGGKVDPRSQLYQRSVAGREQLKDYLSRLSNSGADEADVFMAGVKSLMNRGHGYVGAYLDSKNPGRRYEKIRPWPSPTK
jgi:hypothetical protein